MPKNRLEAIAEVISRECYPWTPEYKSQLVWPKDLTPEERAHCRKVASMIVQATKHHWKKP